MTEEYYNRQGTILDDKAKYIRVRLMSYTINGINTTLYNLL